MADFRRLYNWEHFEYLQAPVAGWNPDAPPHLCPNNQAPILDNLLAKPGKVVPRGPMRLGPSFDTDFATINANIHGAQPTTVGFLMASRTKGLATPWQLKGQPFAECSLTLHNVDLSTPAMTTVIASDRDHVPGYRWIDYDGQLYGIGGDATATLTGPSSAYTVPKVFVQTATADGSVAPSLLSGAPHGAFDILGYQERIWLLGGCDTPGSGTTHYNTALYFTNAPLFAGGGGSASDWQDPVSGLTNVIRMDNDVTDSGIGLAKSRNGMLVFRQRSVWILRGNTTDNYSLQVVSRDVGCLDPRSIVETDQGVYFLSEQGLMLTDGVNVRGVGGAATETLRTAVAEAKATGVVPAYCVQMTTRGQLLVSIVTYGFANDGSTSTNSWTHSVFSGLYDPTYGTWSRITSQLFIADHTGGDDVGGFDYPCVLIGWRSTNMLASVGDQLSVQLEFGSESFLATSSGNQTAGTSGQGMYDNAGTIASPDLKAIPVRWRTKSLALSNSARKTASTKRWFLDYVSETVGEQIPGWSVAPLSVGYDDVGVPVLADSTMYGSSIPGALGGIGTYGQHSQIMRHDEDFIAELTDLAFDIQFADISPPASYPTSVIADLYGIGVEFMGGKDRFNGTP